MHDGPPLPVPAGQLVRQLVGRYAFNREFAELIAKPRCRARAIAPPPVGARADDVRCIHHQVQTSRCRGKYRPRLREARVQRTGPHVLAIPPRPIRCSPLAAACVASHPESPQPPRGQSCTSSRRDRRRTSADGDPVRGDSPSSAASRNAVSAGGSWLSRAPPSSPQVPPWCDQIARCWSRIRSLSRRSRPAAPCRPQ